MPIIASSSPIQEEPDWMKNEIIPYIKQKGKKIYKLKRKRERKKKDLFLLVGQQSELLANGRHNPTVTTPNWVER